MTEKTSTLVIVFILTLISAVIIGIMIGCDQKDISSPVVGSAAGSGPIGGGNAQKIRLTANPSSTVTAVGEEQATIKITATLFNMIGEPMPDGTVVYWSATIGTLDSATQTTTNGAATASLTFSKTDKGCSAVTATSGSLENSISVCVTRADATATPTITPTPSKSFIISADKSSIQHQETATITAYVSDNGKAQVGAQVKFTVSSGGTLNQSAAVTDENGYAHVTFTGYNTGASDITATINGSTDDGRTGSVSIVVGSGATPTPTMTPTITPTATATPTATPTASPVYDVTLMANRNSGNCGSFSPATPATLTAQVLKNGVAVSNVPVEFSVTFSPALPSGVSCKVNPTKPPVGTLTSQFSCSACTGASLTNATIKATAKGSSAEVTITITGP